MNNRISSYYGVKEALDTPVVDKEAEDDSSDVLMDDLLESSDSVYHADVTRFQVNQQKRLQEHEQSLYVWGDAEFKKGTDGKAIDNAIDVELIKMRQLLQYETAQYLIIMKQEKQTRDEAIGLFMLDKMISKP